MSEVPLISTEKQAELLQRSDISKKFTEGSRKWPSAVIDSVNQLLR